MIQKIIRKSVYWHRHGHPVATRGEYARMIREREQQAETRKRRQSWFESLRDLWSRKQAARVLARARNRKRPKP